VDEAAAQVHGSTRRAGVDRLLVPGELEAGIEADYARSGILLSAATIEGISTAAKALGIDAGALLAGTGT
jgi:LDH2 family malate/lactate/ureidoglycolate dehydrogenase